MTRAVPEGTPRRWPKPRTGVQIVLMRAGDLRSGDLIRPEHSDVTTVWWPVEYVINRGTDVADVPAHLKTAHAEIPQEMVLLQRRILPHAWLDQAGKVGVNRGTGAFSAPNSTTTAWLVPWWEVYEVQQAFEIYNHDLINVELPDGDPNYDAVIDAD